MPDSTKNHRLTAETWARVFPWVTGLLGLATVAAFVVLVVALSTHGNSVHDLGWSGTFRQGQWFVTRVDAGGPADGHLRPGDRIGSIESDDGPISLVGLAPAILRDGSRYVVQFERGGQTGEVTLETPATRHVSFIANVAVSCVISFSCFFVAMLLGFARPELWVARLGCATFVCGAFGFLSMALDPVRPLLEGWMRMSGFLMTLPGPFCFAFAYHFYRSLPHGARIGRGWHRLTVAFYVLAALFAVPNAYLLMEFHMVGSTREAIVAVPSTWLYLYFAAFHIFIIGSFLAAFSVLVRNTLATTDRQDRQRMRWMIAGLGVATSPFAILFISDILIVTAGGPSIMTNVDAFWVVVMINGVFVLIPISVGYSILKHRVFGIDVAFRLGVRYLLAKGVLELVVALPVIVHVIRIVSNPQMTIGEMLFGNPVTMALVGASVITLSLRRPLRARLNRMFYRDAYDSEAVLQGLVDEMKSQESDSGISHRVITALESALHPERLIILSRDDAGGDLAVVSSAGDAAAEGVRFRGDSRLARALEGEVRARSIADAAESFDPAEVAMLESQGIELIVPMSGTDGRLLGMLLLGRKRSEEPYSSRDRALLETVAGQMAIVRENAHLRSRVAEDHRLRVEVLGRIDRDGVNLVKECPVCRRCFDSTVEVCDRDGATLTHEMPVDRLVDGKYRLERLLGKGGMGAVYVAEDIRLARRVAVKLLIGTMFGNRAALRRFEREAQASARLNHPNIVRVYDYGALGDSGAYLVMEMLGGRSLRTEIVARGSLGPVNAARIVDGICEGMAAAHGAGIVHRDLKPENIILIGDGDDTSARILDFGLAKFKSIDVTSASSLTAPGTVMGTFGYMSPEQLAGGQVDERSDVFAIGVMAYEALVGRRPYTARTWPELITQTLEGRVQVPGEGEGARRLERVLARCLAGVAMDRYADVRSAQRELVPALLGCGDVGGPARRVASGTEPTLLYGEDS